jgi:hypothetical protein
MKKKKEANLISSTRFMFRAAYFTGTKVQILTLRAASQGSTLECVGVIHIKRVIPSKSEQCRRMDLFVSSSGQSRSGTDSSQSFNTEGNVLAGNTAGNIQDFETVVADQLVFRSQNSTNAWRSRKKSSLQDATSSSFSSSQNTMNTGLQTTTGVKTVANARRTLFQRIFASDCEPVLVMERMEYGSLHDLFHYYTMVLDGELVIPLLVDVCQGLSFLHSS